MYSVARPPSMHLAYLIASRLPPRVLRYTSLAGISLFRRHLHEIPELGITLASVHPDPSASVTTRLRAESTCHNAGLPGLNPATHHVPSRLPL